MNMKRTLYQWGAGIFFCSSAPLIFIGNNIKPEILYTPVKMATIAPTIAHFMRIRAPNAATAAPLTGIRK
jgi:hypothetical protein